MSTTTPLQQKIEAHQKAFISDPDYLSSMKKLDFSATQAEFQKVRQYFAGLISFYNYRHALVVLKARNGKLLQEVEDRLKTSATATLQEANLSSAALDNIQTAFQSSGFGKVYERHLPSLMQNFLQNPRFAYLQDWFREMGATESQISWMVHHLAAKQFNILTFEGANGTLDGLFDNVRTRVEHFGAWVDTLHKKGLTIFDGSMPTDDGDYDNDPGGITVGVSGSTSGSGATGALIATIVVIIILCIIFC